MCGIAGILDRQGGTPERSRLLRMSNWLSHRGPDAEGIHLEPGLGLMHRRLSIIDLDPRSQQPMTVEHCLLVYNGEIFNYLELRAQLEKLGHTFRTESDSEVLVRAYLAWGEECLHRFNGMWAFALWDQQRKLLWCARDRFGVKPFYYVERQGEFRFASEPKALVGDDPALRQVNPRALGRFLVEGINDDEPETFFQGLQPLQPGHQLWIGPDSSLRLQRWWQFLPTQTLEQGLETASARLSESPKVPQLEFGPADLPSHSHPQFYTAVEALRALLQDAVRLRLRSDVPVGTCLSGGMDSSSIVSIASALSSQPIRTFSADYQEPDCSEGPFISAVVEGCKTMATRVTPDPLDLIEAFPKIAWAQDEPTGSATLYTQWKVMQSAHRQVTVLLDGQGGDEIFAGYLPYLEDYVREHCDDPEEVRACQELSGQDYSKVASKARFQKRLPAFLRKAEKLKPDAYGVPKIVHPDLQRAIQGCDRSRTPRDASWSSRLSRRLAHDLTHLSIPQLLRFEDRNSMAFSLEARTPFLDYRLVEFAFTLPSQFKIHRGWTKRILRSALSGMAPPEIVLRRDKKGYPTPAHHWLRGPLKEWFGDLLHSQICREWFPDVSHWWKDHQAGRDQSWPLWRVAAVTEWRRLFLLGQGFEQPPRSY